jgi:hypothetical protein
MTRSARRLAIGRLRLHEARIDRLHIGELDIGGTSVD